MAGITRREAQSPEDTIDKLKAEIEILRTKALVAKAEAQTILTKNVELTHRAVSADRKIRIAEMTRRASEHVAAEAKELVEKAEQRASKAEEQAARANKSAAEAQQRAIWAEDYAAEIIDDYDEMRSSAERGIAEAKKGAADARLRQAQGTASAAHRLILQDGAQCAKREEGGVDITTTGDTITLDAASTDTIKQLHKLHAATHIAVYAVFQTAQDRADDGHPLASSWVGRAETFCGLLGLYTAKLKGLERRGQASDEGRTSGLEALLKTLQNRVEELEKEMNGATPERNKGEASDANV